MCTDRVPRLRGKRLGMLALFVLLGGACEPAVQQVLEPDAMALAAYGDRGPHGVLLSQRQFRVRVDQAVDVEVLWPDSPGAFAPVLLVQGGFVSPERYRWLAIHMASRGHVVIAPKHLLDLAFFAQGNGLDALAALRQASQDPSDPLAGKVAEIPGMAIGHSLGGVVAAKAWLGDPLGLSHLVFLASIPDPGDDLTVRRQGRVLSIIGDQDGMSVDEAAAGLEDFVVPTTLAVVRGMNHYHFTDDASDEELAPGGEAREPIPVTRRRALYLVDAALDEIDGTPVRVFEQPQNWPEGLHIAEVVTP